MSTVKYRTRTSQRKLTAYKKFELLTDEIIYPVINYDGYGDGVGTDLSAFVTDAMREDWRANRRELLRFWASGEYLRDKPWLFACGHGELPWAARVFDRKKQNQDA